MLLVKILVNSKLLIVKFRGSQKLYMNFQLLEDGTANFHIVQGSPVIT